MIIFLLAVSTGTTVSEFSLYVIKK